VKSLPLTSWLSPAAVVEVEMKVLALAVVAIEHQRELQVEGLVPNQLYL
jgi:hypothetical protein